ncbi:MAG: hypothetical protein WC575_02520 [Patescibacteria group bacterium]
MEIIVIALLIAFFGYMALMIIIAILSTDWGRGLFVILLLVMAISKMVDDAGKTRKIQEGIDQGRALQEEGLRKAKQIAETGVTVSVNYDLSTAEAVLAGKYDGVDPTITDENFPATRQGKAEVYIIPVLFNDPSLFPTIKDVIAELVKRNLRPAELPELLAFGARFPDIQRGYSVAGLGTMSRQQDGSKRVCFLWATTTRRYIGLEKINDKSRWYRNTLFVAVKLAN